jgi:hypothetical protein
VVAALELMVVVAVVIFTSSERSVKVVVDCISPRSSANTVLMLAADERSSVSCAGEVTRLVETVTVEVVVAVVVLNSVSWSILAAGVVARVSCGTVVLLSVFEEGRVVVVGCVVQPSVRAEHALSSATQTRM